MPAETRLDTPHGTAFVLDVDSADEEILLPAERRHAESLGAVRRREFIAGRAALRALLGVPHPILADDRGAPILPAGFVGSISHKGARAAALLAPAKAGHVGVDLERAAPSKLDIGRRILTADEQRRVGDDRLAVTLHFAIKEAIYKAIDPIVRRYVGFTEVSLIVDDSGACEVTVVDAAKLPVEIEASWRELDGHWLATARARRR